MSVEEQYEYYSQLANLKTVPHMMKKKPRKTTGRPAIGNNYVFYVELCIIIFSSGKIEDYQSDVEEDLSLIGSENDPDSNAESCGKYLIEILSRQNLSEKKKLQQKKNFEGKITDSMTDCSYKTVQRGGDIPRKGLFKNQNDVKRNLSTPDTREENINIHYKTTVRSEVKGEIPENILDKLLELKMMKYYSDLKLKKQNLLEQDLEQRKHGDNFLPRDKFSLLSSKYEDASVKRPLFGFKAKALHNFTAQDSRELSFQRGNIVTVTGDVDDNWLRGEIGERRGIFPSSYVEFIPNTPTQRMLAKSKFNFKAKNSNELTMLRGEIVTLERRVDVHWVEVSLGERMGIVPLDYLDLLDHDDDSGSSDMSWASSPSTPERPAGAGVIHENTYKPSDLIKSKLRQEFAERERRMETLDTMIADIEMFHENDLSCSKDKGKIEELESLITLPMNDDFLIVPEKRLLISDAESQVQSFQHVVILDHMPGVESELALCVGDKVHVLQDCADGWMTGIEKCSNKLGLFPAHCVSRIQM